MQILMIAINDPAGTAIEFTRAINRFTEHTCRLITKEIRYNFMFEKDLHLPWLDEKGWDEIERLLKTSDIFHFHMTADEYIELGPFKPVDYMKGKLFVHHHHGHPDFRGNPERYRRKYRERKRRNLLVSTPDLLSLMPEAKWQPNLVPINDTLYLPVSLVTDGPIRICQSPTRKDLKNSDSFILVTKRLRQQYPRLETVMIENTEHTECLRIKQSCHIHFDHMQGYFGVSSLESLSQGRPVVAGLDEWNIQCIKSFTGTDEVPWVITRNAEGLEKELKQLINDTAMREEKGKTARRYMERYWKERQVVAALLDAYRQD